MNLLHTKFFLILFFISFSACCIIPNLNNINPRGIQGSTSYYYPIWIQEGTYASYTIQVITYKNGKQLDFEGIFTWKVIKLNIPNTTICSTVSYTNGTHIFNKTFTVDIITRKVYDTKIGYIGITTIWVNPAELKINNTILIGGTIVKGIKYGKVNQTGYGDVLGSAQELCFVYNGGNYDLDTGLLISSTFNNEPLLFSTGNFYFGEFGELIETNIDLGPSNLGWTLIFKLPLIMLFGFIILVIAIIIRKFLRN